MAPLRCLMRISTLPSASASCCLHCSASLVPSSKSLMDSSSEISPRSICATMFSSCLRDCSKFCNSRSFNFFLVRRRVKSTGYYVSCEGVARERRADLHTLHHGMNCGEHFLGDAHAFGAG